MRRFGIVGLLTRPLYDRFVSALFIIDAGHCVYLWQGAWPCAETNGDATEGREGAVTGCVFKPTTNHLRFYTEKVTALKSIADIQQSQLNVCEWFLFCDSFT